MLPTNFVQPYISRDELENAYTVRKYYKYGILGKCAIPGVLSSQLKVSFLLMAIAINNSKDSPTTWYILVDLYYLMKKGYSSIE